jgi:hypothetical protein
MTSTNQLAEWGTQLGFRIEDQDEIDDLYWFIAEQNDVKNTRT